MIMPGPKKRANLARTPPKPSFLVGSSAILCPPYSSGAPSDGAWASSTLLTAPSQPRCWLDIDVTASKACFSLGWAVSESTGDILSSWDLDIVDLCGSILALVLVLVVCSLTWRYAGGGGGAVAARQRRGSILSYHKR